MKVNNSLENLVEACLVESFPDLARTIDNSLNDGTCPLALLEAWGVGPGAGQLTGQVVKAIVVRWCRNRETRRKGGLQ